MSSKIEPWWYYTNWAGPISIPLFLLLVLPSIILATRISPMYAYSLILCYFVAKITGYVNPDSRPAIYIYVMSFIFQIACLVMGFMFYTVQ